MAGKPQSLSKGQEEEVRKIVRRRLLASGTGILLLLGSCLGISVLGAFVAVKDITEKRIARQFEEPNISALLKSVAEVQAKSIIENQVNDEVTRFKKEIGSQLVDFNKYLDELRTRYEKDYEILSKEVAVLKQRNDITRLGDLGTHKGDRQSLEKLKSIVQESPDESIKLAASAEIARIKSFWANTTKLGGRNLTGTKTDGTQIEEKDIETTELMSLMLQHQQWEIRALAAKALRKRKEKGVPDALLENVRNDQHLEVVKWAADSFAHVTGFKKRDVFSFDDLALWWKENAEEVAKKLKDPKTVTENEK